MIVSKEVHQKYSVLVSTWWLMVPMTWVMAWALRGIGANYRGDNMDNNLAGADTQHTSISQASIYAESHMSSWRSRVCEGPMSSARLGMLVAKHLLPFAELYRALDIPSKYSSAHNTKLRSSLSLTK